MKWPPLWESLNVFHKNEDRENLKQIQALFPTIPGSGIREIRNYCHIRKYNEEEHIFRNNEPGVSMYIILSGKVQIYRQEHDTITILAEHKQGDSFGEVALVEDLPRSASARAITACTLLAFSRPDLEVLKTRKPALAMEILHTIARYLALRLIRSNEALENAHDEINELRKEHPGESDQVRTPSHRKGPKKVQDSIVVESLQIRLKRSPISEEEESREQ